jgi:Transposase C of IS166 homeodomain/zinc-finger binding domain of transposase IS66
MVAYLKLLIAKMKRERFGQSAERGRKRLDQLELQLEDLEASAAEDAVAAGTAETEPTTVRSFARKRPVRGPLPAHLPREPVVVPAPPCGPCCGGRLVKLGEDITETLEVVPRQWKVIQTVREKFTPAFAGAGLYGAFGVKWFDVDPFGPQAEPRLMFPLLSISLVCCGACGYVGEGEHFPAFRACSGSGGSGAGRRSRSSTYPQACGDGRSSEGSSPSGAEIALHTCIR